MFNSRRWADSHGETGDDPYAVDEAEEALADLRDRHAAMARRIFTVAEPTLEQPELAEVQARVSWCRQGLRVWLRLADHSPNHLVELDQKYCGYYRQHVRDARAERHRLAAKLAREEMSR